MDEFKQGLADIVKQHDDGLLTDPEFAGLVFDLAYSTSLRFQTVALGYTEGIALVQ